MTPKCESHFHFTAGIDQINTERWKKYYFEQAQIHQVQFEPHPYRIIFLDIHAMQAEKNDTRGRYRSTINCLTAVKIITMESKIPMPNIALVQQKKVF